MTAFEQLVALLTRRILDEKALDIRDVDAGEEPFLYSSGMIGPGYAMIKGLVGKRRFMKTLVQCLAIKVAMKVPKIGFVAGNATGGMIPAWILAEKLSEILDREIPYVYIRNTRKKGGRKELITGLEHNDDIKEGDSALVVEELVNMASTTCNSAGILRDSGFVVTDAACIFNYGHENSARALREASLELTYVLTLPELLDVAEREGTHSPKVVASYRDFLKDPAGWMAAHNLTKDESGGTL
jgi:orotate phosphoribosyltransferase